MHLQGKGCRIGGMKTCIGVLLLIFAILSVIVTLTYHTSVNGSLSFEQQRDNPDYINTNRSYRPPKVVPPSKPAPTAQGSFRDDEEPEVVAE